MTTVVSTPTVATGGAPLQRVRVPWSTVLPLAVVAAFGSQFWVVAIRGAVGATERTSEPFAVWLRESVLLLPVYVCAVLAAVTLALRWFGDGPRRARAVAVTLLLVVLAATLAGVAVQAANAVYDYVLQAEHVATTSSHGVCDAGCIADRQQSALLLQVRALGLGGVVMLASNLVLLGLLVAFRGGRLDVASRRRDDARVPPLAGVDVFLVAGLLGAAAVNAVVVGEHLADGAATGAFFAFFAIAQAGAAGLVLARVGPAAYWAAAVVAAEPLLLWLSAWTLDAPAGLDTGPPQSMGLADVAATLLALGTLVLAIAALRSRRRPRRPHTASHASALLLVALVAVAVVGAAGGVGLLGAGQDTSVDPGGTAGQPQHPRHDGAPTGTGSR
jgi:hypothetical protein